MKALRSQKLHAGGLLVLMLLLAGLTGLFNSAAVAAPPSSPLADFSGERCSGLVIGVPNENLGSEADKVDAGMIHVLYSRGNNLSVAYTPAWTQDSEVNGYAVEDVAENSDEFGSTLAVGDFNGDRRDDIAVGMPKEDIGTAIDGGAVHILYGSDGGITAQNDYLWHQGSPGIDGAVESGDNFGYALAVGDFDGDGYDDLAVGVPYEDIGSPVIENAGSVHILYGSSNGISAAGNTIWDQDTGSVEGGAEENDFFGVAVAAGDFDGDGLDDLAIGVPFEDVGAVSNAGAVNILYGSRPDGLTDTGDQIFDQNDGTMQDQSEVDDHFGWTLATGDFDGDGYADLAIGAPDETNSGGRAATGAFAVLYGTTAGLSDGGNQYFWQGNLGDESEVDDHFGRSLVSGDFNGDRYDDLAAGAPDEDLSGISNVGAVSIVYGTKNGLLTAGSQFLSQACFAPSAASDGEKFGFSLAAGDYNCDLYDDLTIGSPYEDFGTTATDSGLATTHYGSASGLACQPYYLLSQATPIGDNVEDGDHLGWAVASRRIDWLKLYLPLVRKQ